VIGEERMSFRLADLKKTVRKGRDGHQVSPARLDSRGDAFKIEFLLQQFEQHLGRPRRNLDPDALLDFVGDARLGRGLMATLSQWYRTRARTFPEVLGTGPDELRRQARLIARGIVGPVDLRAWLYGAVNQPGDGYLDPDRAPLFWQAQVRALGIRQDALIALTLLDRAEEAILVRTGPRPSAADVMAAYNARAHSTLVRSASEVVLTCGAPGLVVDRAAGAWATPLEVEWERHGELLRLKGKADAFGCWTRHGRRVERAALELLAAPELRVREVGGSLRLPDKQAAFRWRGDVLDYLGTGAGTASHEGLARIVALAEALRKERREGSDATWGIHQASHLVGVEGAARLPHLEVRRGDLRLFLRMADAADPSGLEPFREKTPVAAVAWSGDPAKRVAVGFPEGGRIDCALDELLPALGAHLDRLGERWSTRSEPAARKRSRDLLPLAA
jgi:hypothetical protein